MLAPALGHLWADQSSRQFRSILKLPQQLLPLVKVDPGVLIVPNPRVMHTFKCSNQIPVVIVTAVIHNQVFLFTQKLV